MIDSSGIRTECHSHNLDCVNRRSGRVAGFLVWFVSLLLLPGLSLSDVTTISDIEIQGLERVSTGAVYSNMSVDIGDRFDDAEAGNLIQSLYNSGFFDVVDIGRDGSKLVIRVEERPAIASLEFEGNKDIETEQLEKALQDAGIAKGKIYNRLVVQELQRELRQQYFARGKYNVKVETDVTPQENNQVDVKIDISEGVVTKIKRVNIIGNETFTDDELMDDFDSGIPSWWAFLSSRDDYSKPKLSGDLERLRAFYLDRGYLNFNIDSTQVTITPDKQDIYITINVTEGGKFTVKDYQLQGDLVLPAEEIKEDIKIAPGDTFSRVEVTRATTKMKDRLGAEGYAFAEVGVLPVPAEDEDEVGLVFNVKPGKKTYIRRISFFGNTKTRDEVLRREMRQMEGGLYSTRKVNRSKVRIQRLPFIETVDFERKPVAGRDDQVDLNITVTERFAGSFSANLGFSQTSGIVFGLALDQANAFGSGKKLSLQLSRNDASNVYSISYTDPYHTIDGVSRGFNAFFRETDANEINLADYLADRWGLGVNYGIPLTEYDFLRFNLSYENTSITTNPGETPEEIESFIRDHGDSYGEFLLSTTYTHDTRDRTVFPNKGNSQRLSLEASIPGSDLDYYKINYRNTHYFPLSDTWTFSLKGDVAYGEGYGDTEDLPFYEKYYAGGIRSVRGYDANTLGPVSTLGPANALGTPLGGNFRTLASAQILFPAPFAKENRSVRMGAFVDAGNVFNKASEFESSEMRASAGLSFEWLAPVGPLVFSFARPLNDEPGDDLQEFQFSVGGAF